MSIVKIKEAIEQYNSKQKRGEPRLTQKALGAIVLNDQTEKQAEFYISRWINDKSMTKLGAKEIIDICLKTGVSPNFLLGWEETVIY